MNTTPTPQTHCYRTGKLRLRSAAKAKQKALRLRPFTDRQRAYQCPFCGDWHLTSQPKRGAA